MKFNNFKNIELFKLIYINNLNHNVFLNKTQKIKTMNRLSKINNILKYYEEIVNNNNFLEINIYISSKIIYNIIFKFIKKLKFKKPIIFNNEDLLCNTINNNDITFNITIDNFIYKFTYNDFIKLINNALLNYTKIENADVIDNIIIKPIHIKNPYTNLNFSINILYNFYNFCINNNKKIPLLFKLFYYEHFNLKNFFRIHEVYIIKNAYKIYIRNCDIYIKHSILISLINNFINFINKYIKNFSIKYLLTNYKIKFYNMTYDEIQYYDNYINDYMMLLYYYKTKQYKNFLDIKLKYIFNLLYDKNIKVVDPLLNNLFLNRSNEEYIITFLMKNLQTIISNELNILENNNLVLTFINETAETREIEEREETREIEEIEETREIEETGETREIQETLQTYDENNQYNNYLILYNCILNKISLLKSENFNIIYNNYNILLFKILLINIQIYINIVILSNIYKNIVILLV